jgi:hypothetical protein
MSVNRPRAKTHRKCALRSLLPRAQKQPDFPAACDCVGPCGLTHHAREQPRRTASMDRRQNRPGGYANSPMSAPCREKWDMAHFGPTNPRRPRACASVDQPRANQGHQMSRPRTPNVRHRHMPLHNPQWKPTTEPPASPATHREPAQTPRLSTPARPAKPRSLRTFAWFSPWLWRPGWLAAARCFGVSSPQAAESEPHPRGRGGQAGDA